MHRTPRLLALVLLAAAAPAAAQPTVAPRETVRSELTASDPTREHDAHYDSWQFTADADTTYLVRLRSTEFDALVLAGPRSGDTCEPCDWDGDDGEGGAAVGVEAQAGATYVILASTHVGGETGRYTLTVEVGVPEPEPGHTLHTAGPPFDTDSGYAVPILFEGYGPESGVLEASDPRDADGVRFDPWSYPARGRETTTFILRSGAFAPLLRIGRYDNCGVWRETGRGEAGSAGGESRLTVAFTEFGRYELRAGAAGADGLGEYTISLVSEGEVDDEPHPEPPIMLDIP